MAKVLILGCGTQGLAMSKALHAQQNEVYLLFGDKNNYADASRYIKKKFFTSLSPMSVEFCKKLIDIIQKEGIETLIPMGDVYAEMMALRKSELKAYVKFQMPDYGVFQRAYDKNQLMKVCQENHYPHPLTITNIKSIDDVAESELSFPLLIKPNITCGARGMTLVSNYQELLEKFPVIQAEYGDCHLQKYIKQGGSQVEVQLYIDEDGQLINSSVISKFRWYPEKGGSSCCAISVKNEKIVGLLYDLLKSIGWVGFADFDTIEDPETGELLIMELNPRVPACVKTAIVSGINWGQIIVDDYLGNKQKKYEYSPGEVLRHLGFATLWFLKSPNRWRMHPSYFKFFGKHIHYQDMSDWTDPMPFIRGTLHNIKKVFLHKEKQKIIR